MNGHKDCGIIKYYSGIKKGIIHKTTWLNHAKLIYYAK